MKLTYHLTLELAPNAICLQKCWTRAWTEITSSLTSWLTCIVLASSFGRLLGDVYQEVRSSAVFEKLLSELLQILSFWSEIQVIILSVRSGFIFSFISVDAVIMLPGNYIRHPRIIFDCFLPSPATRHTVSFPCLLKHHCFLLCIVSFLSWVLPPAVAPSNQTPFSVPASLFSPSCWAPSPTPFPGISSAEMTVGHKCGEGHPFLTFCIYFL